MEVPTILYFPKQKVDISVPHGGRGASGGLQGFLPGHSSFKRSAKNIADIPAPRSGARRLQGFLPEQSATAFGEADHRFPAASVEQIVDNPALGGGLQDSRPGQSSASSYHHPADLADDAFELVFNTFPKIKKNTTSALEPMDASCSWRPHGARGRGGGGVRGRA